MNDKELEKLIHNNLRGQSVTTFSESTFVGISLKEIRRVCRVLAEQGIVDYVGDDHQKGVGDVTHVRIHPTIAR